MNHYTLFPLHPPLRNLDCLTLRSPARCRKTRTAAFYIINFITNSVLTIIIMTISESSSSSLCLLFVSTRIAVFFRVCGLCTSTTNEEYIRLHVSLSLSLSLYIYIYIYIYIYYYYSINMPCLFVFVHADTCGKAELWLFVGFLLFKTLFQNAAFFRRDFRGPLLGPPSL